MPDGSEWEGVAAAGITVPEVVVVWCVSMRILLEAVNMGTMCVFLCADYWRTK